MLGLHLDRRRGGSHYSDRMHRILGVCHSCGILWHEEKVSYRAGVSEVQRIEDVRPQGSVLVTPQYEKYGLHVNPRVLPRLRGMAPQFAYALNVPAVAVEVDGDVVYVRVPRDASPTDGVILYENAWALAPDIKPGSLLLGVDEEQQQLVLNLEAPSNVHAAVIGMTGSGKSTLMKTMILSAEMAGGGVKVALFDPSGGFQPLSGHPAVWRGGMFRRAEECEAGLSILAKSLGRDDHDGTTYVFVDEVPELVAQQPRIKEHLGRLAQAGRHAGMHLVLGAQHPLTSELGATTLRNIPVRLVGRVADNIAAYNAAGRSDSGAENLRGQGDFLALNGASKTHFQAAMCSAALLQQWVERYPPRAPRIPPKPAPNYVPPQAPVTSRFFSRLPAPADDAPPAINPLMAEIEVDSGGGSGRPYDDLEPEMVEWAKAIHKAHPAPSPTRQRPSCNDIARESERRYGVEWGRDKAHRLRALVLGSLALPADHAALAQMQEASRG